MKKGLALGLALIMLTVCAVSLAEGAAETETDSGLHADIQQVVDSPEWVANLPAAQNAGQLFVVAGIGMDKTTAYISMYQKDENGAWMRILSTPSSNSGSEVFVLSLSPLLSILRFSRPPSRSRAFRPMRRCRM